MPDLTAQQLQQLYSLFMPKQQSNIIPGLNNQTLGLGLLTGASTIGRDEPGYLTEARQNMRNLSSPTGFSSGFTNTVAGLQNQFQPLIDQQQQKSLNEISQRYTAAFPGTAGAQPQEFGGYASYLRDQFMPGVQNFYGQMGMQGLNTQFNANNSIIQGAKPDPFRSALAALGGTLLAGQGSNGGGLNGLLGTGQQGGLLNQLFGGGNNNGGGGGLNLGAGNPLGSLGNTLGVGGVGGLTNLTNLFTGGNALQSGLGLTTGLFGAGATLSPAAGQALMSSLNGLGLGTIGAIEQGANGAGILLGEGGQVLGTLLPNGQVIGANGAIVGSAAGAAPTSGLTSFLGGTGGTGAGLLGLAGAGLAGFGAGSLIGGQLPGGGITGQGGGALAGAAGGAAAGAIAGSILPGIGTAIGAIVGALAGSAGGFFKSRAVTAEEKAANLKADTDYQTGQSRTIADYFLPAIAQMGGNTQALQTQVAQLINSTSQPGDQQGQIAQLLGNELLKAAKQQNPAITSLSDIPGFRESFLTFMMNNAKAAPTASSVRPLNELETAKLGAQAGLDSATPGVNKLNVNQYGDISHVFENVDRATPADAQAVITKLRSAGYNGPLPASLTTPVGAGSFGAGRMLVQTANALLRGLREGLTPEQTIREYSIV